MTIPLTSSKIKDGEAHFRVTTKVDTMELFLTESALLRFNPNKPIPNSAIASEKAPALVAPVQYRVGAGNELPHLNLGYIQNVKGEKKGKVSSTETLQSQSNARNDASLFFTNLSRTYKRLVTTVNTLKNNFNGVNE